MANQGLLALDEVVSGVKTPESVEMGAAWLDRIKAVDKLADKISTKIPVNRVNEDFDINSLIGTSSVKKELVPTYEEYEPQIVVQETYSSPAQQIKYEEKPVDMREILQTIKKDKIGIIDPSKLVKPDEIQALLEGRGVARKVQKTAENAKNFLKEVNNYQIPVQETKHQLKPTQIIDSQEVHELKEELNKIKLNIRQYVNEEVVSILFEEIFNQNKLKPLLETILADVIQKKATQILYEALEKQKAKKLNS